MIEFVVGTLIGGLVGAAIVAIVVAGSISDRELMAYRKGYRAGLEDRSQT